ncbi:Uncharacterised protein [Raoultella terrigena]|uniref:Uncharacterized protein n=1 Tax=Raoultella terrigena TaxID=577 RepID=A0A485BC48_RAOTE|nr:Uncharacterised protein [Raoultella terrigena]
MSQTVITSAFEQLKAQEAANGGVVILDEFGVCKYSKSGHYQSC